MIGPVWPGTSVAFIAILADHYPVWYYMHFSDSDVWPLVFCALAVLAACHYHLVNLAIERGEMRANRSLIVIVTIAVAFLSMMMIAYLLLTVEHL